MAECKRCRWADEPIPPRSHQWFVSLAEDRDLDVRVRDEARKGVRQRERKVVGGDFCMAPGRLTPPTPWRSVSPDRSSGQPEWRRFRHRPVQKYFFAPFLQRNTTMVSVVSFGTCHRAILFLLFGNAPSYVNLGK